MCVTINTELQFKRSGVKFYFAFHDAKNWYVQRYMHINASRKIANIKKKWVWLFKLLFMNK